METDPRFAETKYVVKATFEETYLLWTRFSNEAEHKTKLNVYCWEQDSQGFSQEIGACSGLPVRVCCWWYKINGVRVLFYEGISMVVHHGMIDDWIEKRCNPQWRGRKAHTNATNFLHVLNFIDEVNKE